MIAAILMIVGLMLAGWCARNTLQWHSCQDGDVVKAGIRGVLWGSTSDLECATASLAYQPSSE
jgi:hypothetical protein